MRIAKETRALAWQALRAKDTYGTFLLALLLLTAVCVLAVLPCIMAVVGFVVVMAAMAAKGNPGGCGESLDDAMALLTSLGDRIGDLQPGIIAGSVVISAAVVAVFLYLIGFATWSRNAMAIAAARGGIRTAHAFSGWGNGWRMATLVLWRDTLVFLQLLLLIVPGVRAAFSYAMAPFLQIDHPDWTALRCIDESKRLMEGNRWRLFCLGISFIGWYLLVVLVNLAIQIGGIASFFLEPYPSTATAIFYDELLDDDPGQPRADAASGEEPPQESEETEQERNPAE